MLSKIFLALLAACTLLMAFFTYYAWSWLQSIGAPATAAAGYTYHDGLAWTTLVASSLILLIFGNVILWMTRSAWALWSAFVYFAVFAAIRYLWMDQQFMHFQADNGVVGAHYSAAPLFGALLIIAAAIFTFCDHFAIVQLHRTMYSSPATVEDPAIDVPIADDPD